MMDRVRIIATTLALLLGFAAGAATAQDGSKTATAVFAGGCFWCVESDFDKLDGVLETVSGYTGGTTENPTYREVVTGGTGHYEAVRITYDPERLTYRQMVDYLLRHVDPTDAGGQFCDRGHSYKTAIFTSDEEERAAAKAALEEADALIEAPVVTPVLDAAPFYVAEDYHQDYYLKNPLRYRYYRLSCGRDARVKEVWGSADKAS
ncbi:MAG: peptide-methionine (S)-S-oxide reductase MsrA [Pseudomonadota bacterium]